MKREIPMKILDIGADRWKRIDILYPFGQDIYVNKKQEKFLKVNP